MLSKSTQKKNSTGTIERIPLSAETEVEVAAGSSLLVELE
jgi:hypothetical protein